MNEKIKALLGEELATQVAEKLGDVQLAVFNDGSVVPAEKHDGLKSELKEYKSKLEETNKLVSELNEKAGLADEWKTKATDWESKYKDFEAESENRLNLFQKRSQTKDVLAESFPKSAVELILDKVDYSTIELADGKIKDAETLLSKMKETYSDLAIKIESNSGHKDEQHKPTEGNTDALRAAMGLPPLKKE